MPLCEYGCGREATTQFKNGKWCCGISFTKCPSIIKTTKRSGKEHPMYGRKHTEETKQKISENRKGIDAWNKGKTGCYSEKVIRQMSIRNKKENLSKEQLKRRSEQSKGRTPWNKGKSGIYSEETLKKMSENSKGQVAWNKGKKGCYTEETLKRMGESKKRENLSEETRKKMSEWARRRVAWNKGKKGCYSKETIEKIRLNTRLSIIKLIEKNRLDGNQLFPNYNPAACALLDEYGKQHGYNFKHAMNGGEHYFKELGYWVDGYDSEKNVAMEIDEAHHFDLDGNLLERDLRRQKEIEEYCGCTFIRIKI